MLSSEVLLGRKNAARDYNHLLIVIVLLLLCLTCVWNRSILDGLGYDGPVEWYTSFEVSSFPET